MSNLSQMAQAQVAGFKESFLGHLPADEMPNDELILRTIFEMAATTAHLKTHFGQTACFKKKGETVFSATTYETVQNRPPFKRFDSWLPEHAKA